MGRAARRRAALGLLGGLLLVGGLADVALAVPGQLDASFGDDGRVTTDFGGEEEANGLVLQTTSRIVVVGRSTGALGRDIALARYLVK
jgi:hypothetical protein